MALVTRHTKQISAPDGRVYTIRRLSGVEVEAARTARQNVALRKITALPDVWKANLDGLRNGLSYEDRAQVLSDATGVDVQDILSPIPLNDYDQATMLRAGVVEGDVEAIDDDTRAWLATEIAEYTGLLK